MRNVQKRNREYMIREIDESEKKLLRLVRIGIGNEETGNLNIERKAWNQVYNLASKQGVLSITFNAIQSVEGVDSDTAMDVLNVSETTYLQWLGMAAKIQQQHANHETAISELAKFYSKADIPMMLLKGYGLSLNYPTPSFRPSGDIDIWLMGKQQEADRFMAENAGITPIKSSHHTIFKWMDCEVENHITILEYDTHKSNIKLDKELTRLANAGGEEIDVLGQRVLLPSVAFNSCFILRHNAIHFAIEHITLRHLLDWATFVKKYNSDIKWDDVFAFAKRSNTEVFLNCQNAICVQYLGFDENLFPVRAHYPELNKRIIADILQPEFDDEAPDMRKDFMGYCMLKTKRLWANRWKSRITNSDSFGSSLLFYSVNRIKETIFGIR